MIVFDDFGALAIGNHPPASSAATASVMALEIRCAPASVMQATPNSIGRFAMVMADSLSSLFSASFVIFRFQCVAVDFHVASSNSAIISAIASVATKSSPSISPSTSIGAIGICVNKFPLSFGAVTTQ